ncbi:MAG: NMD3-related protein [Candidatus Helarchaeota archaeon]
MQNFCFKCGNILDKKMLLFDNLCQNCYIELHPLLKIPPSLEFKLCKKCHRFVLKNRWISSPFIDLERIIDQGIKDSLPFQLESYPHTQLQITTNTSGNLESILLKNVVSVDITAIGTAHKSLKHYTEKYSGKKVKILFTICPSCLSLKRGEYKAVLHVIAPRRHITHYEQDFIFSLIENEIENAKKADFTAYISKLSMKKRKITLFIGSEKFARSLALTISYNLGGILKETYKFGSQRIPKEVKENKLYISLYLPPFLKGDLLRVKNAPLFITGIRGKMVRFKNLITYEKVKFPLNQLKNAEIIQRSDEAHQFLYFAQTNRTIQLMDIENYQIYELPYLSKYNELDIGKNYYGFDVDGQILLII